MTTVIIDGTMGLRLRAYSMGTEYSTYKTNDAFAALTTGPLMEARERNIAVRHALLASHDSAQEVLSVFGAISDDALRNHDWGRRNLVPGY